MPRKPSIETRNRILEVVIVLLRGQDFPQITTRQIASEAEISEATLFRYFPCKDDIMTAVVEQLAQDFFSRYASILEVISNPLERLRALSRLQAAFAFENRDAVRAMEREITFERTLSRALLYQHRRHLSIVEELISECVEEGSFKLNLDTRSSALAFNACCSTTLKEEWLYETVHETSSDFQKRSDVFFEILLAGLLAG